MSSKFMAGLTAFFTSFEGIIVSATALVIAVRALLKELNNIGLPDWMRRRRKAQADSNQVVKHHPRHGFGYLAIVIALLLVAAVGFCVGLFFKYISPSRPLELEGSTNVYGYLKQHYPDQLTNNVLLSDLGSAKALEHIFQLFDYGRRVADPKRQGVFALSSNGTVALRDIVAKNSNPAFIQDNYWLNINLAQQPLFILYRGIPLSELKVERANQLPPEAPKNAQKAFLPYSYNFVRVSELKRFLGRVTGDKVRLYLPEPGTGTRALFDASQRKPFDWPNAEQLPAYIEQLNGVFPLLLMASDLPSSRESGSVAQPCKLLQELKLKVAFICADNDNNCDDFPRANLSLIVKLARDTTLGGTRFHIANAAECNFARAIYDKLDASCNITGNPEPYHIIELNPQLQLTLPEYSHCDGGDD
jgi:hypothetical protein